MSELPSSPEPSPQPPKAPPASATSPHAAGQPKSPAGARPVRRSPLPAYTDSSKRDTMIALVSGLAVLLFIVVGFYMLQGLKTGPVGNKLTGTVVEKYATGVVEKEITIGKKGLGSQETESGFYLKVKVPSEGNRIFEVPVREGLYEASKVGDTQSFIRPLSEQK